MFVNPSGFETRAARPGGTARPMPARRETAGTLTVDVIETETELEALRPGWQALHRRDPEANVFLSWDWMATALRQNPGRWRVYAVRAGRRCLCIFPVKYRVHWSKSRDELQSELEAGGRLLWSEYTGFLCDPERQQEALQALAGRMARAPWAKLSVRYEPTRTRAEQFTAAFPEDAFRTTWKPYRINDGETDNLVSPQVALPADYETYLQQCLSRKTREKLRRLFRRHLDTGEVRVTETTAQTFDRDAGHLLRFWIDRWTAQKGAETARTVAGNYRRILKTALDLNLLFMPVLWRGDRPIGALGHILDPHRRAVHFIVAGRDPEPGLPPSGMLLHAWSIRQAIESGYALYDFCHGNEAYKYSFGARDKPLTYFSVRRRADAAETPMLDPISTSEALERAIGFIEAGRTAAASAACRQIMFDCL